MVPKRAIGKEQDTSHPTGQEARARPRTLRTPLDAIADSVEASVARCVEDAAPEAVHRSRTGSRRLQATLEAMVREAGPGAATLSQPARAWLRPLKQIRRAAGPVRDLDVHLKLLESWLGAQPAGDERNVLETQAARVDEWLKKTRAHLAHPMQKQIAKRGQALPELRKDFFAALDQVALSAQKTPRPADAIALEDFVRAADAMPLLHAENLHDFRKAIKKARYVAESGVSDPKRTRVGKALKRIQDAIGEWHDWLCLAQEASTALADDAPELTSAFRREVERHFAAAIKTTESVRSQLLGEWIAHRGRKRVGPATALFIHNNREASSF